MCRKKFDQGSNFVPKLRKQIYWFYACELIFHKQFWREIVIKMESMLDFWSKRMYVQELLSYVPNLIKLGKITIKQYIRLALVS